MYKRVLPKLSEEALSSPGNSFDPKILASLAKELKQVHELGVDLVVVVGEGNFICGRVMETMGTERVQADYMGTPATVINTLAVQSVLEQGGVPTRIQTVIKIQRVAEPFIVRRINHHLGKGCVIIFGTETGSLYFSMDTTATPRASEVGADVILMAKDGVDGIYNTDPKANPGAIEYDMLTYMDPIQEGLATMDTTAANMCMDNDIDLMVFNTNEYGNILGAA